MKHPIVKILLVFISGIIVARVFWFLGFIPNLFRNVINPGNCSGHEVKTIGMYICSAFVAFKMMLGPLLIMLVLFVFRKSIMGFINKIKPKIPNDFQFLLAPLVSTLLFTIVWSGTHPSIMDTEGIIDQRSFPVIVGLFTFITTFYYKEIQKKLLPFFEKRDKFSKPMRYMFAFGVPFFLSLIITFEDRVSNVALKEQIIVIVSLVAGYLVLLPKSGTLRINLNK